MNLICSPRISGCCYLEGALVCASRIDSAQAIGGIGSFGTNKAQRNQAGPGRPAIGHFYDNEESLAAEQRRVNDADNSILYD